MTDQPLARRAVSAARRRPQISAITLAACVSALAITAIATAQAKQQCSAAQGSGGYWSWRMIDGRKCWYEGKPMLSKSLLEWSARAPAQARSSKMDSDNNRELASASVEKRHDPLDAQARAPDDAGTFEALWRDRIEKR
ncbi:MAG TPA: hypothetical protein VNY08_07200 [Bradyrhizobium sp.]|jgi:hypothetical protein|nr:hypothetical protein [Bradyrhizobium sp.]